MATLPAKAEQSTSFQPLYAQVYALMTERIGSGQWQPGALLPNEFQLAAEFKVSQGTVRKALMALEANKLIVRRQGHGTYVARHTAQQALFQFFRIVDLDGTRLTPASRAFAQKSAKATRAQTQALGLKPGAALHSITRVRSFEEDAAIFETIMVPAALMPGLSVILNQEMPEEMYVIYQQHFGITITRADETLAAVAADAQDAAHLQVPEGTPLLEITRIASDLNGKKVELRVSRCKTSAYRYAAEIT
ncbi:GntR family transcriptional regulator [Acidocella facilis]|uniref:GntR family transcriptional regulator n=1 Tax=Acidocella facilis TaxID=525 RepID=UPI00047A7EF5|nr:GntR family transcriptional regulator [Acidocella facilis]